MSLRLTFRELSTLLNRNAELIDCGLDCQMSKNYC